VLKRQRNYILTVDVTERSLDTFLGSSLLNNVVPSQILTIKPPFTLEFDIIRNVLSSANTASFRIYNLAEKNRKKLYKDPYTTALYKGLQLHAGYGALALPTIFRGNVFQGGSVREGVNYITTLECFDAGFAFVNSETAKQFPKGTPTSTIMKEITKDLPNVSPGAVGSYPTTIPRGNSYSGNSADLLRDISNGGFFVDLEKANILQDNEYIQGDLEIIDSDSGLLGTPRREGTLLQFDILFEPRLIIGQKIHLDSSTASNFNGDYKIMSIHHRGTISEAVCGDAITTVGLWYGTKQLNKVG
jgi:hypothetical protein